MMTIVAIAWLYVVLLMAAAEALSPQGSVLGALVTLALYGVLPLALVLYVMATPHRRRARRAAEATALAGAQDLGADGSAGPAPDGGGEAAGDAVAPVGKEA